MKTDFIPIDYDYFDFKGRNHAKIIGRNSKGKRICVIDSCPVYFWAILKQGLKENKINSLIKKIEKIKVIENGEVVSKKISEFSDGENVKTISWDFKNKKEVVTDSEVIVEDEEKEYYEVELENGKKVVCTMEHNLFVRRRFCGTNDKMTYNIIETKLKNLKEGDELVCLN